MKFRSLLNVGLLALSSLVTLSCSKNEGTEAFTPKTLNVSGKVEKGPFVSGSTITIQPMDSELQVTGEFYSSTIQDNTGSFSFGSRVFQTPYAELAANGYFFHEVSGQLSSGTLNLRALVDLSDKSTVNVNILTHLKYQRVVNLVHTGKSFTAANEQAQTELLTAFGLQKYAGKDASSFSMTAGTDESAALIAISALLIVDRKEAALTEYLAKLCREFETNGTFSEDTQQQMETDKKTLYNQLTAIKRNLTERYNELGLDIQVKELAPFFDWDNDGTAGNETLQEGQEITLEVTQLNVPNKGGNYKIKITAPIPVYLESSTDGDHIISPSDPFSEIYDGVFNANISYTAAIDDGVLSLEIAPLESYAQKSSDVCIYDCIGNELGKVTITQEGNKNTAIPQLGKTGKTAVSDIESAVAQGFSTLNFLEQYYHYNKETDGVAQYVYPLSRDIERTWAAFYGANRQTLQFKFIESQQLNVYQHYFDVLCALYYYNMVVVWGDVPYIDDFAWYQNMNSKIARTDQQKILNNLKTNLETALNSLEEKKNESLKDENGYLFLSRDVARVLLADIHMYQGDYAEAESLLEKVIQNGFYELNASDYSKKETIDNLMNGGSNTEILFAAKSDAGTPRSRSGISISQSPLIPVMTYTDVVLSYAECLYKRGDQTQAGIYLNKVVSAKGITVSDEVLTGIKEARMQLMLYGVSNFAFLKRNNLAEEVFGVEKYRLLLPIPESELFNNSLLTQNPEYH